MSKHKQSAIPQPGSSSLTVWHFLLPYVPFALPILYLYPVITTSAIERYRAASLVVFGLFGLALLFLKSGYKRPSFNWWQSVSIGLVIVMLVSSWLSQDVLTSLFGINTDYQGLIVQLSAMVIGYWSAQYVGDLKFWRGAAVITTVICAISIVGDIPYILDSYRESGLVMHATGMGLYAAVCLGLNTGLLAVAKVSRRWQLWHYASIATVIVTMLLTASRIALLIAIAILIVQWVILRLQRRLIAVVGLALVAVTLIGGNLLPASGRLTSPGRVESGVSYRLDLYRWSLQQSHVTLIGVGASQVADTLASDKSPAPARIQATLDEDFAFWYSHNQFIDNYIQYGLAGLILLSALIMAGGYRIIRRLSQKITAADKVIVMMVATVFGVGLAHLLVNTPSLELASLVWLGIFGALRISK